MKITGNNFPSTCEGGENPFLFKIFTFWVSINDFESNLGPGRGGLHLGYTIGRLVTATSVAQMVVLFIPFKLDF